MDRRHAAQVVAGDLESLDEALNPNISDARLRQTSSVLRRLLVDGTYIRAWHEAGLPGQPVVEAPDLEVVLSDVDHAALVLATAGPVYVGSQLIPGIMIGSGEEDPFGRQKGSSEVMREWRVSAYLERPCMLIRPEVGRPMDLISVNVRNLIKYVANKLGGVHLDTTRKELGEEIFQALDWTWAIDYNGRPTHMFEVHACAQALARSSDSRRYREKVGTAG